MGGMLTPFMNQWFSQENPMGFSGVQPGLQQRPYGRPMGWTPNEEAAFRPWMQGLSASAGTSPHADNSLHAYDYRGLFRDKGALSMDPEDGLLHGSSAFKSPNHPNRFVIHQGQMIDSITGQPVSPEQVYGALYQR
jgi:hypothetical protein